VTVDTIAMVNNLLYVYPSSGFTNNNNQFYYAVNPANGKMKATYRIPPGGWYSPIVNGVQYFVGGSALTGLPPGLYAVNLSSKKQLWHHQFPASQGLDENVVVKDGIVYVSPMIMATGNRKNSAGLLYAFDANTGKQLWKSLEMPTFVRNFIVTNGVVYCASGGASSGDLVAFDSHTGKLIWHLPFKANGLLVNAGVLYLDYATNSISDGGIAALQTKDGKQLWKTAFTGTGEPHLLGLRRGIIYTIAGNGTVGNIDALRASDGAKLWNLSINGDATKFGAAVA